MDTNANENDDQSFSSDGEVSNRNTPPREDSTTEVAEGDFEVNRAAQAAWSREEEAQFMATYLKRQKAHKAGYRNPPIGDVLDPALEGQSSTGSAPASQPSSIKLSNVRTGKGLRNYIDLNHAKILEFKEFVEGEKLAGLTVDRNSNIFQHVRKLIGE
jgi:hypothetical protein